MQVLIANTDFTQAVDLRSLEIQDAIGERSTARFTISDLENSFGPVLNPGATVQILHDGTVVFGGTIDRVVQTRPVFSADDKQYQVDCVDWHQTCDRRVVAEAYENTRAGEVVRDLVRKYLAVDGIVSSNLCSVLESWTLANGATIDSVGVLHLPNSNSYAESPFIKVNRASNWWFTADYYPEAGTGSDKLLGSSYYQCVLSIGGEQCRLYLEWSRPRLSDRAVDSLHVVVRRRP